MHIVHADNTILFQFALDARVIVLLSYRQAALTSIAMEEILSTPNSTYPATFAVEYFLFLPVIIIKVANSAKIPRKLNSTLLTILFWSLFMSTIQALDLFDFFPQELMVLFRVHFIVILDLVMTEPTSPKFTANRAFFLAPSPVVLAPKLRIILRIDFKFIFLRFLIFLN